MTVGKLIPPRVPLTDPRTGLIGREWYLFFQRLYSVVDTTETGNSDLETFVNSIVAASRPTSAANIELRLGAIEAQLIALQRQINTSQINNAVDEIRAYVFGAN